jgi:macrodomain Ter protein organizer (MatP/YcbG family)
MKLHSAFTEDKLESRLSSIDQSHRYWQRVRTAARKKQIGKYKTCVLLLKRLQTGREPVRRWLCVKAESSLRVSVCGTGRAAL